MWGDADSTPWAEDLKGRFDITKGFEKEVPFYLSEFLLKNVDNLRTAVLGHDLERIRTISAEFSNTIPRESNMNNFEELFFILGFKPEGKPYLLIVKGQREKIDEQKVRDIELDISSLPVDSRGILIFHTHPEDTGKGLSEADIEAISGPFSNGLRNTPLIERAYLSLVVHKKPGMNMLFESQAYGPDHYFSIDDLRKKN